MKNREITNRKLTVMLASEGFGDVRLIKGNGYFYLIADGLHGKWLNSLPSTDIMLNSFNMQSVEKWFDDIMAIMMAAEFKYFNY